MAQGDLSIILETNGSYILVTAESMGIGGAFDFGFGAFNDPTNATFIITVNRPAFNAAGGATYRQYTIRGIPDINFGAVRQGYPNQAIANIVDNAGNAQIRVKLEEPIYDGDIDIAANVEAAWYNQGGVDSNQLSAYAITNTSTLDYPIPVVRNLGAQHETIIGTSYTFEIAAYHKWAMDAKPVACVKYTATDEHSNTVSGTITDMTISQINSGDQHTVLAYADEIDLSALTDLDLVTIDYQVYPWVGDSNSVLDSDDAVNVFPTIHYTNYQFRLDKLDQHGKCMVDPTSGNDGTGVVYATRAAAEAGLAYQTHAAALTAVQAYHNSNLSRNDAGGGLILLTEDTHEISTTNGGAMTEWVTFEPVTGAAQANVLFNPSGTNSQLPGFAKIKGATVQTGSRYFTGHGSRYFWIEGTHQESDGGTTLSYYNLNYGVARNNTGAINRGFAHFSTNPSAWALIRGNDFDVDTIANVGTIVGNNNVLLNETGTVGAQPDVDGFIYQGNYHLSVGSNRSVYVALQQNFTHGCAIVGNVFERITAGAVPMLQVSADDTETSTNHVMLWHNTNAGERWNIGYNDLAGGPWPQTNWSMINNVVSECNCKQDVFAEDPNSDGGWTIRYGEGFNSNIVSFPSSDFWWINEFPSGVWGRSGSGLAHLDLGFTDDQSLDGGNTGGGDYTLTESSPGKNWIHKTVIPFDYIGNPYIVGADIGAYSGYTGGSTVKKLVNSYMEA